MTTILVIGLVSLVFTVFTFIFLIFPIWPRVDMNNSAYRPLAPDRIMVS